MAEELWTTGRLLKWTTDFLKQHGVTSPRLDAEVLLAFARQCDRISLYTSFSEEVDDRVRASFRDLIKRRAAGCPVAYLVGHREFYSLDFEVTPDVLIPRPETEFLVMTVVDWAKKNRANEPLRIVDVGTGSGVVAICLAKYLPLAQIVATDISSAALKVAQRNAERHHVEDRIRFIEADLAPPDVILECDALVSNPPYIGHREKEDLSREVFGHEPHTALFGGERGDELTGRLLADVGCHLREGAVVFVEINADLAGEMLEQVEHMTHYCDTRILDDLAGRPRVLTTRRGLPATPS